MQILKSKTSDCYIGLCRYEEVLCKEVFLSKKEEEYVSKKNYATARKKEWIAGRCALKILLNEMEGIAPEEISILADESGKPLVLGDYFSVSLAHKEDHIIVSYSKYEDVGVDLERIDSKFLPAIQRACSFPEMYSNQNLEIDETRYYFYLWSMKEAMVKSGLVSNVFETKKNVIQIHACEDIFVGGLKGSSAFYKANILREFHDFSKINCNSFEYEGFIYSLLSVKNNVL